MPSVSPILALFALALTCFAVPTSAQQPNATLASCGGTANFTSMAINPPAPQAGQTVSLNTSGVASSVISGGAGTISAFLFGVEVFTAPIGTCGLGQQIDILSLTTAYLDALACPVEAGANTTLGVVIPIPSEAYGLGQLNITLSAQDQNNNLAYCFNLSVTL